MYTIQQEPEVCGWAGVKAYEVDTVWPYVEEYLQGAIGYSHGEFSEELVLEALRKERMQLWIVFTPEQEIIAAIVTEVITMVERKICYVTLAGGRDIDLWLDKMDIIESWAAAQGAPYVRIQGRQGFSRLLKSRGYGVIYHVLEKDLRGKLH